MTSPLGDEVEVVDSHTAGEPTRVVIQGGPDLGHGSLAQRLRLMAGRHDHFRRAVVGEPRGSDVLVGALLSEPSDPAAQAGVIFFNNVGYLGMCGHGTIGLVTTLAYLGRLATGRHQIETPVGLVTAELHPDGSVSVHNVPAYRHLKGVALEVVTADGSRRRLSGDVAWGGNWFFLSDDHGLELSRANIEPLVELAWQTREALAAAGITGAGGAEIDHIEFFGKSLGANSRSFVLCPGKAYDRSPCGTGTSAKLACLHADGKLAAGETWRQESVIGTTFDAHYQLGSAGEVLPVIRGQAFVTARAKLLLGPADPFRWGI